jgi:predicted PurR-regulated permease PerM
MDKLIIPTSGETGTDDPAPPSVDHAPGPLAEAMRNAATRAVLLAAALVGGGLLFHELVTLVAAGVITLILAIALSAVADPLQRRGVPRPLGALAGLLMLAGVVATILLLVVPPLAGELGRFVENLPRIANALGDRLAGITGSSSKTTGESIQRSLESATQHPDRFLGPLASFGFGLAGLLSSLVVIVITAYYMAAQPQPLIRGALRVFPPRRREWVLHVMTRIRTAWQGWMKGVLVDMAVSGLLLYVGLMLVGLDYAILFAALSALLVVVPYFGAIAGAFPPVLLALTDSPQLALLTLGVYLLVQQIEGNLIVPLVMARMLELHPAVIALGVVVVAQLFGLAGLFVAVPILSAIVILVEELWVRPQELRAGTVMTEAAARRRGLDGRWLRRLRGAESGDVAG